MEEEQNKNKKDIIIGILGLVGIATFTTVGLIIKHMFFMA